MASRAADRRSPADRVPGRPLHPAARFAFLGLLAAGIAFAAANILIDTAHVGEPLAGAAFLFLGLALLIALGFEFVNGFHDTANAVATVIYTRALPPTIAVMWSGAWNFAGVLASSGAVAYAIVTLLPVELVLNIGSVGGYAMLFALLLAAVIWNLGTWWLGLPNSSSHALIGSILGVGLAHQLLSPAGGAAGVDWGQARTVLLTLLVSPVIGFLGALVLLKLMKRLVRDPRLYAEPEGDAPPPAGIRALLIATCTAVSFAHGGNDGQKGMGLVMLILIGVAPTAYALNRTMPDSSTPAFVATAGAARHVFRARGGDGPLPAPAAARATLTRAIQARRIEDAATFRALDALSADIARQLVGYGSIRHVPAAATPNLRNEMYLAADALHLIDERAGRGGPAFSASETRALSAYRALLERGTRFIPTWVKIAVALALGLGTMVGWKRIVVTVGERIGRAHLTYGMGASAELVAAATILLAEVRGLPVSTTHILSSGVAGAMAGEGAGVQAATVRGIALAWVATLPAAMAMAGLLYWLLTALAGTATG